MTYAPRLILDLLDALRDVNLDEYPAVTDALLMLNEDDRAWLGSATRPPALPDSFTVIESTATRIQIKRDDELYCVADRNGMYAAHPHGEDDAIFAVPHDAAPWLQAEWRKNNGK